jgi:hypothetical protein
LLQWRELPHLRRGGALALVAMLVVYVGSIAAIAPLMGAVALVATTTLHGLLVRCLFLSPVPRRHLIRQHLSRMWRGRLHSPRLGSRNF